jgi:benzodiazapine receptor
MSTSTAQQRHTSARSRWIAALAFAAVTVLVAVLGSVATGRGMDWYETLDKPGFTPLGATFGIVWTVLYVMIAVGGWRAWRAAEDATPTWWWGVQMSLNLLWTVVFFGWRAPWAGVVVIAVLIAAVVADVRASLRVDRASGLLLVPYLLWCCFAAALTVGVAVLN